jgi:hypothetical protein
MVRKILFGVGLIALMAGGPTAQGDGDYLYKCGNVNGSEDGQITLSDITSLIAYVYLEGDPPAVMEAANVNGSEDGLITLSDITRLIAHVYIDGWQLSCRCCVDRSVPAACLPGSSEPPGTDGGSEGHMYVEVIDGALHVHHVGASYQCCLEYAVEFEVVGNQITATEYDHGQPCDCICPFDLESVLYYLSPGEYVVTLIGIYGETIGVDTALISSEAGLIDYDYDGCIEYSRAAQSADVVYSYENGKLTMEHNDAYFNCVAKFIVTFEQAGDTLRFYELNVSLQAVYCLCYFEIRAVAIGIPPGEYVAEIWGQDGYFHGAPVELLDRRVIQLE